MKMIPNRSLLTALLVMLLSGIGFNVWLIATRPQPYFYEIILATQVSGLIGFIYAWAVATINQVVHSVLNKDSAALPKAKKSKIKNYDEV